MRFGLILLLFSSLLTRAQDLSVVSIPDSVRKSSNIVVRESSVEFTVYDEGKAVKKTSITETILNKTGQKGAGFHVYYNDHRKIKKLSAVLLDARGKVIKKYRSKDFEDVSTGGGSISDGRLKYIRFHQAQFPYTTKVYIEEEYAGIVSYPFWNPIPSYKCGVEKSEFSIIHPEGMAVQIKQLNCDLKPEVSSENGYKRTQWTVSGLKPIKSEPYSPKTAFVFPSIWTAPVNFDYEGTQGSMESWEKFGVWSWSLLQGRDDLSEGTQTEIRNMVDTISDPKKKIEVLYKYMQSKTRYVSIQLGIGGWQPFPASKVDETGYGDCKALSNYMRSVLKVVGIESFYTIIGNGSHKILFEDFACMGQANHAVLCVPVLKDTIWLECTSQSIPFGYFGESNCNRKALLVTDNGGVLVNTPRLKSLENRQIRNMKVKLLESGDASVEVETYYSGGQFDNRRYVIKQNVEDQKKWLLQNLDLSSPTINDFSYSQPEVWGGLPRVKEDLNVKLRGFSSKTGSRIFFPIMVMDNFESTPTKVKNRKNDVYKEFGYVDIDTINYTFPEGYRLEVVPPNDTVSSIFGEYVLSMDVKPGRLQVRRKLHMHEGQWPADTYKVMLNFYTDIRKRDNCNVVLVRDPQ